MYHVLRGGCETKHPRSFVMSRPKGINNYLILIIHTAGVFQIAGQQYNVIPGQALVLAPNTPYSYGNPCGNYIDDWLHFEIMNPEIATTLFPCLNSPFAIGEIETYTFLIRQILWEASYTKDNFQQENINALFTVLINHLQADCRTKETPDKYISYQTQLQMLKLEMSNSLEQQHSIKDYAKEIGISESYFQHLYTAYFGTSFQKDLIKMRIERAKYNLITSDLTIEQIAKLCGYASEVHFYRQFKSITGITPAKYRAGKQS
ncbi:MAG: helix-turn-helix domain-containing protein [Lachnospiraceae bacterium]|nr:helix-turn-helix domain-containing protein [Lachnospiraceae bacterium]